MKNNIHISDRFYWFFRNLLAFITQILFYPMRIILDIVFMLKILFLNTNGSEVLSFPWEDDFYESYFGE